MRTSAIACLLAATAAPASGDSVVGVRVKSTFGTTADVGLALDKVEPQLRTCWAAPPAGSLAAVAWLVFDGKGKVARADVVAADGTAVEACVGKVLRTVGIAASPLGKQSAAAIELVLPTRGAAQAFDMKAVERVLKGHLRAVNKCFERHPAPPRDGRNSNFAIGPTGKVVATNINTGDKDLDACLVQIVKPLEFPPPGATVPISFPYPSDPT